MMWGESAIAESATQLVSSAYTPPSPTGTSAFNMFPKQQRAENYLTATNFTIGGMQINNATIDINTPFTFVNDESCLHCKVFSNSSDASADFASYNSTMSNSYRNLGLGWLDSATLNTLYDGETTVNGTWSADMWSNSNGVNNNVQSAELTFFMIEEIDSVLDTFGYGEVLGLGQPLDTDTTAPSSYSLVNALYYANVIN